MIIKDNLRYTKDHEWLDIQGDTGTIGITDFAQGELGDVVYVELPAVGTAVKAGEPFGTIEAVKAVSELYAPVSGTVSEVNTRLADEANLVNQDCYGAGWMIKIKIANAAEANALLSPKDYSQLVEQH
ncbi:MAG TPA: glycine cleavage system protein GcvH [bacterium]|nr:glycine cleavage system protein GcvH [bacterium]